MTDWREDKRWSDHYIPLLKRVVARVFVKEASLEADVMQNTDLIVLTMNPIRIGCRVRRHKYLMKYGHEITIRTIRPSGAASERDKIMAGWGDYFLYAIAANTAHPSFALWRVIGYPAIREYLKCNVNYNAIPNRNGSSDFIAIPINALPEESIIDQWIAENVLNT